MARRQSGLGSKQEDSVMAQQVPVLLLANTPRKRIGKLPK